jgi:hypothetical protein
VLILLIDTLRVPLLMQYWPPTNVRAKWRGRPRSGVNRLLHSPIVSGSSKLFGRLVTRQQAAGTGREFRVAYV